MKSSRWSVLRRSALSSALIAVLAFTLPALAGFREVMLPMRDGVNLATNISLPDGDGPWPVVLSRTHPTARTAAEAGPLTAPSVTRMPSTRSVPTRFAYPWKEGERGAIDLAKVRLPVLAINGELDGFHAKTHRLEREVADFTNVMLPGKSHLSAIEPGYIPDQYIEATVAFVEKNDPR